MDIAARAAQTIAGSTIAGEREPGPETTPTILELIKLQSVAIEFGLPQDLSPLTLLKLAVRLAEEREEYRLTKRERARRSHNGAQYKLAAELNDIIASGKTKAAAIRLLSREPPYCRINKSYFEKMCHCAATSSMRSSSASRWRPHLERYAAPEFIKANRGDRFAPLPISYGGAAMTIHALVTGKLLRAPEQRASKTGKPFVTGALRVPGGNSFQFVRFIAFSETAQAELLRLDDGDAITVQGSLKAEIYEKDGEHRISLSLVAEHALALRQPPKTRKDAAPSAGTRSRQERCAGPDDAIPFGEPR